MVFEKARFIKPRGEFKWEFCEENSSSVFYKTFHITVLPNSAVLRICALGIGYAYINGKRVSEDLFAAPPSDYEKRLWYMQYDVTSLLQKGENSISVLCGNGFFSEDMKNGWSSNEAAWRDHPKMIAEIECNGKLFLSTDETWKGSLKSPYLMNRYRQGVFYDARIPAPNEPAFDASAYENAIIDERAPRGVFTRYESEPIRELQIIEPVATHQLDEQTQILDFGVNISGYVRLFVEGNAGDTVRIRYGETLTGDGNLYEESVMQEVYFPEGEFATERLVCNGKPFEWSTLFSYYGFRYVELKCENLSAVKNVKAVFVAQNLALRSSFECSDTFLNKLFACGVQSTRCNLFYEPTDCPTREKYGWMNDAQSSSEQILTNFHAEKMLLQWNVNICDAFLDDKGLPGIVPTHGWGYTIGNGPVSDGSLFEQVYRVYLHSGNKDGLIHNLPYFRRYFAFLKTREDENGFVGHGLFDWANPTQTCTTPKEFINAVYRIKFNRIAALAARLAGESDEEFVAEEQRQIALVKNQWLLPDGRCAVNEQTAVALLIYYGLYEELEPLKKQLMECVEERDFHHNCGIVGLRHLYLVLNSLGLQEYAMRIVTASGFPSYREWIDQGATTLWEFWDGKLSRNHHMFSDLTSWLIKTVGGISPDDQAATFDSITIKPYFFHSLDYAKAHYDSPKGRVGVDWRKVGQKICLKIDAPCDGYVGYEGKTLQKGVTEIWIEN